ncbi:MAG TPA: hypothetical protein PLP19_11875 [bacterium]|nr:hypothetical protein [bacterium]HPN44180.1 hypothetical protein [bacterium]
MRVLTVIFMLVVLVTTFTIGAMAVKAQSADSTEVVFENPFQISIAADLSSITIGGYAFAFPGWFIVAMGIVFPLIYQPITRILKNDVQKAWATFGMSLICGTLGTLLAGFDFHNLPYFLLAVFGLSVLSYFAWWKKLFKGSFGEMLGLKPESK